MVLLKNESVKIMNDFDKKNRSAVMNFLTQRYSIPEADAEDILQDAWVVLLDKLAVGELPDVPEKLLAYIKRVCSLKAHEYLRKRNSGQAMETSLDDGSLTTESRSSMEMEVQSWADFTDECERAEHRRYEAMCQALETLSPRQKALLLGYHLDHRSMKDLALQLGYSNEVVARNTKRRILAGLRSRIQQQERADGNRLSPVAFLNPHCLSAVSGLLFYHRYFRMSCLNTGMSETEANSNTQDLTLTASWPKISYTDFSLFRTASQTSTSRSLSTGC